MSEPTPGGTPTGRTVVRVLADRKVITVAIRCDDPDAAGIVSFTRARDASLQNEDHVRIVLDTVQDARSGYVFAVNPGAARYDALIEPGGGTENANWDGLWESYRVFTAPVNWRFESGDRVEFNGEYDAGRLDAGDFTTTIAGTRVRLNLSPDLTVSSYLQYDSASRAFGTNTRLRWTVSPVGDLFVIYNHNIRDITDRWQLDSNQLLVKFQYAFRY